MTPAGERRATRAPLRTLLGDHPATRALRQGRVASPLLSFAFADVAVPNTAFKRVVRDLEFDVAELALMTFLLARSRDVPLRLLPVVVFSRNPLLHLVCDARRRVTPADLPARRIGVRTYTTTTAVWIRALLADQCGVPLDAIEWLAMEEGHVPGVPEPRNVHRVHSSDDVVTMLCGGVIDAAIVDRVPADSSLVPVVPDPEATWMSWQRQHGARTLNHVIVVRESLSLDAEIMRELLRLFGESRELGGAAVDREATPLGLEANRRNLEMAMAVAQEQGLMARRLTVDDLVANVADAGVAG